MASLNERLMKAAYEGKGEEIEALLDQGADIDCTPPPYQVTPLIKAIHYENEAAALYLMERGADVRLADDNWNTALHLACKEGLEAVARALLKRGADVEAESRKGYRPLHSAAFGGHKSIVRLLVTEHGAQINARDRDGVTPLMAALVKGNEGVASLLLFAGADHSVVDRDGWSTLHYACRGGLASIVARLFDEFGLDLHEKTREGRSCLHFAAFSGRVKTCKLLLERGLPVDELDNRGQSPLFDACWIGNTPVAELLLDHGADIEHKDDRGRTPLLRAIIGSSNREQVALLLIQHGARLDVPLPRQLFFRSIDEELAGALENGFLKTLFAEPDTPIPPYRRVLRWALASPAVTALVQGNGWSLLGTAKADDEVDEMIKKRLGLFEDDAWKRRMHLVIDRALDWGYGHRGKASTAKKAKPEKKKEEEQRGGK